VDVRALGPGNVFYYNLARAVVTTPEHPELLVPTISFYVPDDSIVCGNHIAMVITNGNEGSYTEVYRAPYPDGDFELIHTTGDSGSEFYTDENLQPQKTYYYKAQAIKEDNVSEFSPEVSFQSGSAFHNPVISGTADAAGMVTVKFEDRSFLDSSYEIYAINTETGEQTFSTVINLPDSGGVYHLTDTGVTINKTYSYHVNATLICNGSPVIPDVASDTVTVTGDYFVTDFVLVDPDTDQDVFELSDSAEFDAAPKFNIRANASPKTQSVLFHLNGKPHKENQVPYALFGDTGGNYNLGRLKPGFYTLTATAYSGNNNTGVKGGSLTIHFTVRGNYFVSGFVLVDPDTDQDVMELADYAVFDEAPKFNIRANASAKTQSVLFHLNGKPHKENQEPYALFGDTGGNYNRGRLKPGSYTLTATAYSENNNKGLKGDALTIHFTVKGTEHPQQDIAHEPAEEKAVITIYPNPVVNNTSLEIKGTPQSPVSVAVISDTGRQISLSRDLLSVDGHLKKDWDFTGFKRGIYYFHIRLRGKEIIKRVVVE
jgi:hypothetical protein